MGPTLNYRSPSPPTFGPRMDPPRFLSSEDVRACRPVYAVWEITLKCDLKCAHCGSRAGQARPKELSTAECLDVVSQLAKLGCREVTLIGGEAYLRNDWVDIIRGIRSHGMACTMTTGGRNLTEARVKAAAEAGLQGASVSIDGIGPTHDAIRGVPGSYLAAVGAIERLRRKRNTYQALARSSPVFQRLLGVEDDPPARNSRLRVPLGVGQIAEADTPGRWCPRR